MCAVPTTGWSETSPAGSDLKSAGDNRIRELKTQVREVVDIDHQFNSSGSDADNGKHKKCSFLEQADLGTGATGKPILGAQTIGGKPECVYTDEDDNDVQITSTGNIRAESIDGVYPCSTKAKAVNILDKAYPVGSIYINATDNTNPGTLLGFGTWVAFGAGRVIVGLDSGDVDFDTSEETGGSKTHTLTTDEIPSHTHTHTIGASGGGPEDGSSGFSSGTEAYNQNTGSTGGGQSHNNVQPYIVVYMWKRTA